MRLPDEYRMSTEEDLLAAARAALRARLATAIGEGEIARFDEALTHPSFAN